VARGDVPGAAEKLGRPEQDAVVGCRLCEAFEARERHRLGEERLDLRGGDAKARNRQQLDLSGRELREARPALTVDDESGTAECSRDHRLLIRTDQEIQVAGLGWEGADDQDGAWRDIVDQSGHLRRRAPDRAVTRGRVGGHHRRQ
jgi:hypothetical protein